MFRFLLSLTGVYGKRAKVLQKNLYRILRIAAVWFSKRGIYLKKKEALFIGALLVISVVLCIFVYVVPHGTHGSIQITVDGELYGTYSLDEDQVIQIGDTNVCEIKDGEVKMTEADCPDHLCIKQPAVGSAGGYIVCLPNRVVIHGEGDSDSQGSDVGFDAVV